MLMEEKRQFEAAEIRDIQMKIGCADFKIETVKGAEQIAIRVEREPEDILETQLEDGVLKIWSKQKWGFGRRSSCKTRIFLLLPEEKQFGRFELELGLGNAGLGEAVIVCDRMRLNVGAGSLTSGNIRVTEGMRVEIGAGEIEMRETIVKDAEVECGMGKFHMNGKVEQNLSVECGMGKCELGLRGKETDYNYNISCGMGKVKVNGAAAVRTGGESRQRNNAAGNIKLSCGMGEIILNMAEKSL